VVAGIVARLIDLPPRSVVLAEDETHLNLLPHVRASWTLRGARPQVLTPGTNRKVTVLGAIEMTTGAWVYRLGRRRAADFITLLDQVLQAFPLAPVIAVICDNDSIHHARKVTAYLKEHPRLELLYGARYSPHDNPAERIWAALKNYRRQYRRDLARTAETDPLLLPQPLTGPDAGDRRTLDQPLAAASLRAELLECRLAVGGSGQAGGAGTSVRSLYQGYPLGGHIHMLPMRGRIEWLSIEVT